MKTQLLRYISSAMALIPVISSHVADAYQLNVTSQDSLKLVSQGLAKDLMSYYSGHLPGQTPGLLPEPYYWWEGGALMGAMMHYWYQTRDPTYNTIMSQALLHQVGPDWDYMPPNQTLTEGNDDQGFWGMAVLAAAEYNFPNPPKDQPQWLALAQAVFNTQAARWDTEQCGGGLRWQIFPWNNGFDYKNSISQACFFNIAARLALYTGNATYAEWAIKTWDWMKQVNLIDEGYRVYDGVHIHDGCVKRVPFEFSYNVGAFLHGASAMWAFANKTGHPANKSLWGRRVDGLLNATELVFFWGTSTQNRVMIEIACEPVNFCNKDQQSFKAYLSRWMSGTTVWAPWTFDRIKRLLENSATAAVNQCIGGSNGKMCGLKWANNSGLWDGTTGVGPQMAAMEVVLANMIKKTQAVPLTNSTGGTSLGNPSAGISQTDATNHLEVAADLTTITAVESAGALIGTVVVLITLVASVVWLLTDENKTMKDILPNLQIFRVRATPKERLRISRPRSYHQMTNGRAVLPANINVTETYHSPYVPPSRPCHPSSSVYEDSVWRYSDCRIEAAEQVEPVRPQRIVLSRHRLARAGTDMNSRGPDNWDNFF